MAIHDIIHLSEPIELYNIKNDLNVCKLKEVCGPSSNKKQNQKSIELQV